MNTPRRNRQGHTRSRHHPENRASQPRPAPEEPKPKGFLQKPHPWIALIAGSMTALITWGAISLGCYALDRAWQNLADNPLALSDSCRLPATIIAIITGSIAALTVLWISPAFFPED